MVSQEHVIAALKEVGMHNHYWSRPEMRELQRILAEGEKIIGAVNGRYEGGFALLIATDRRLLLIDKKMMFLNMEDIRYDMISQVEYCARLIDATINVHTINSTLKFTSWRQNNLRSLTTFMQERVMELRHMIEHQAEQQVSTAQAVIEQEQLQPVLPETTGLQPQIASQQATEPAQTFGQEASTRRRLSAYPNAPLTIRRRISRFYPLSD